MTPKYEQIKFQEGYSYVIGCDEVGRGSLAGSVVAAAVILDFLKIKNFRLAGRKQQLRISEIKDSKKLSPKKRDELSQKIKGCALAWSVAEVDHLTIDKINIHQATLLAMKQAVERLMKKISGRTDKIFLFVDGQFTVPDCPLHQQAMIGGDGKILSVAAASIIAKVHRDNLMLDCHRLYPDYGFNVHKGYGTFYHRQQIVRYGLSKIHRKSFCQKFA